MKILVINAGSSSIKFALFEKENLNQIASGIAERIGIENGIISISFDKKYQFEIDMKDHLEAAKKLLELFEQISLIKNADEIELIGFRVVHGGIELNKASKLDQKTISIIEDSAKYAPLHNPGALQAIKAFQVALPKAKLSVNLDTAFHSSIDKINYSYPINYELAQKLGIRKFGFHGISHRFITNKLEKILNKKSVNFVNLHIGNGASLCAVKDSKSIDTSMGFTPLAGIMMGTRSGDIDPSIHEFVCKEENMSIEEFTSILNKKSGIFGVSQISSDLRDVEEQYAKGNEQAIFALDLYSQKIADYAAIYLNKIAPQIDAIVFTAGVGENSAFIRKNVISRIKIKNIELDETLNSQKVGEYQLISTKNSEIPVYVIRTNEELMIASDAKKLNS
ncbi:acetate/propionate family kinase [Mycoplasmopsis pulmonis]|uniref:acetate/propionate family kinase n=1 Tax=Mycoplasmopsis pulmonis TaxID=2107 RepID=UPI001004F8C1|nr:acetate/propionate family kinase [Mycoplasmopsis pulmonis]MDZ7293200.1 acetate/propionate family kinase [Mycoplasmopsis pulmonis]VEU67998.1 acetate kinase [Mycoplasmopsis pulmonis]